MPNLKISELNPITNAEVATDDLLAVADVSVPQTKKMAIGQFDARYLTPQAAFLTSASAAATYLRQDTAAATYLTQSDAAATYATIDDVGSDFLPKESLILSIDNNQSSPVDLTGLLPNPAWKSMIVNFSIDRKTNSANHQVVGFLFVVHNMQDDEWRLSTSMNMDSDTIGVEFDIDSSTGQISYTSDNLMGVNYSGTFNATIIPIYE